MRLGRQTLGCMRAARAVCLAVMVGTLCTATQACELVLSEQRSTRELLRLPLDAQTPEMRIAFAHSVLGTPVVDLYRFDALGARLVEEHFEGEGYGLPHAAFAGERLERDGAGWRLRLDRPVQPLVVRPLPALGMRLLVGTQQWRLADLTDVGIEFTARGCLGG